MEAVVASGSNGDVLPLKNSKVLYGNDSAPDHIVSAPDGFLAPGHYILVLNQVAAKPSDYFVNYGRFGAFKLGADNVSLTRQCLAYQQSGGKAATQATQTVTLPALLKFFTG